MPMNACESARATLFYVEGDMEVLALRKHFGVKAKKIGLYGHNVKMAEIANKIAVDFTVASEARVLIMFDRESRAETVGELRKELLSLLEKRFPKIAFQIAIPDRDTECWIFADTETSSRYFGKRIGKRANFEGCKGSAQLKQHLGPGCYDKMSDGVNLIGRVRWSRIEERSSSARSSEIAKFFTDCGWFNQ